MSFLPANEFESYLTTSAALNINKERKAVISRDRFRNGLNIPLNKKWLILSTNIYSAPTEAGSDG